MPAYSDNKYLVKIDGVDISSYLMDCKLTPSGDTQETTRGNAAYKQRAPGLGDYKFECTVSYDDTQVTLQSYIRLLKPLIRRTIEFGSQGGVGGTPRHVQDFIATDAPVEMKVDKSAVAFSMSFDAADAPIIDMYDGGVY